jgi:DUF4097 and DUF4098 domain-containing protein YvlB
MQNERYATPEPIRLRVELPAGELEVDAERGRKETEVELRPLRDNDASRAAVEDATVRLRDGELTVEVHERRRLGVRRAQVGVVVRCPEGSDASVRTKSADVLGRGRFGAVAIGAVAGRVNWGEIAGDGHVDTVSGDVRLGPVAGDLDVNTVSGDVAVERVGGRLRMNGVSAAVDIREAAGPVKADTVSGDVAVGSVENGDVVLASVSGDLHVGVKRGSRVSVDATAVSGTLESEIDLSGGAPPAGEEGPLVALRAHTVSGDLRIVRA